MWDPTMETCNGGTLQSPRIPGSVITSRSRMPPAAEEAALPSLRRHSWWKVICTTWHFHDKHWYHNFNQFANASRLLMQHMEVLGRTTQDTINFEAARKESGNTERVIWNIVKLCEKQHRDKTLPRGRALRSECGVELLCTIPTWNLRSHENALPDRHQKCSDKSTFS